MRASRYPTQPIPHRALLAVGAVAIAAHIAVPVASAETAENYLEGFRLYGSLRAHIGVYDEAVELQGNASRIGFRLTRDFIDSGIQVFGQGEFGLTFISNIREFNVSGNQGNAGLLEFGDAQDAIYLRLGFLGFDFAKYGVLTAGKQWSTYYDVSGYTDIFWVFGGQASGTYPLSSDGGGIGTGRASKALTYRNQIGGLRFGAQAQLEANKLTGLGSFGGSLQYFFPFGLTLGTAGNYTDIPQVVEDAILGADSNGSAVIFGAKIEQPRWYLAVDYSIQNSQDTRDVLADSSLATVAFDATGIEVFGYYELSRKFRISGGFNYLDPDPIEPLHPDFRVRYFVLGGAYYFNSQTLIYAEWKFDDSISAEGTESSNQFALGVRLDFGLPEMQRNDAPPLRFPESKRD